jgi:hypothetical protein
MPRCIVRTAFVCLYCDVNIFDKLISKFEKNVTVYGEKTFYNFSKSDHFPFFVTFRKVIFSFTLMTWMFCYRRRFVKEHVVCLDVLYGDVLYVRCHPTSKKTIVKICRSAIQHDSH